MLDKLLDKSAKIAVVDNAAATRQLLSETVKSFGFPQVHGMANIQDVVQFLETDTADLVICSLEAVNEYNALSLLTLFTQNPSLKHVRVCLLTDEEDEYALPACYSLGLVGHFCKPFTKDSIKQAFSQFLNHIERHKAKEALVAAEYIRPMLRKNQDVPTWLELEKKLLNLFPGSTEILVNLAEPLFLSGKKPEAISALKQSILIDAKLEDRANELLKAHGTAEDSLKGDAAGGSFNALGLDKIVIVDKDETIQNSLKDIMAEIGAKDVQCFADGEAAAQWIKDNPEPQLVIQEWKIPKLSGPMFVQRIVKEGASNSIIIVLSSLVQQKDLPLLREMGVVNIVEKPFEKSEFVKTLVWTVQQERMPSEQTSLEIKIRRNIRNRKKEDAEQLLAKYVADPKISDARKLLMQAEMDYLNKDYQAVKNKCVQSLKSSTDSVHALALLGKALMQLREFDAALKCLEKAQTMSPQNIERLCNIAEVESEIGAMEQANESINEAKDLDPNNVVVAEAEVKVAMNDGDTERAKEIMHDLESLENLIAHMNNRAVALARIQRFDDSMDQYDKAANSLPDNKPLLKSLVLYNFALALIRAGKLEEAKEKLDLCLANPSNKVKSKAASLKQRLDEALGAGKTLQLATSNDPIPSPEAAETGEPVSYQILVTEVLPNPGDIGCYMIFTVNPDDKIKSLLAKKFTFTARESITRDETLKDLKRA